MYPEREMSTQFTSMQSIQLLLWHFTQSQKNANIIGKVWGSQTSAGNPERMWTEQVDCPTNQQSNTAILTLSHAASVGELHQSNDCKPQLVWCGCSRQYTVSHPF